MAPQAPDKGSEQADADLVLGVDFVGFGSSGIAFFFAFMSMSADRA